MVKQNKTVFDEARKKRDSLIIDQYRWLQNREVCHFIDCIWGVFNWLIHYFLNHKGGFWGSSAVSFLWEAGECHEKLFLDFELFLLWTCLELVEKAQWKCFPSKYLYLAFPKMLLNTYQSPLQWMSLLQKQCLIPKQMFECWTVIFIEGQMAHTHTYCLLLYTCREREYHFKTHAIWIFWRRLALKFPNVLPVVII